MLDAEKRLGPIIFRDMLGTNFAPSRPMNDELRKHLLATADADTRGAILDRYVKVLVQGMETP